MNHIITDEVYEWFPCFDRVNVGDSVDPLYGYSEMAISKDELDHLLSGGVLHCTINDEYSLCIAIGRD